MRAFCKNCGASIEVNTRFCRECGSSVTDGQSEILTKPTAIQTQPTKAPVSGSRTLILGTVAALVLIILAVVFFLRRAPGVTIRAVVTVPGAAQWTGTGIYVHAGDEVEISATGNISIGPGSPPMPPEGIQPNCEGRGGFPAGELPCWSLIGRMGQQGPIFYVGRAVKFQAVTSGLFLLGVNDQVVGDNSGSWTATIAVNSNAPVTVASVPPTPTLDQGPPVMIKATVEDGTEVQLPPGSFYVYGYATGGAAPSDRFVSGHYAQATDAAGQQSVALAFGTSNQNSYSTQTGYHVIGGASIGGVWNNFMPFYGANEAVGASTAQVNFIVPSRSLVVVIALASSQQKVTIAGIPGLQADESSSTEGMLIGHAYLEAGTYIAVENSGALAGGQDAQHMADLIGVFVFSVKQ